MKTSSFSAGLITGAVVGAVAGIILDPLKDNSTKKIQNSANGMFRSIGSVLDGLMSSR